MANDRTPTPRAGKTTIRGLIYLKTAHLHHRLISDGKKSRTDFRNRLIRAAHAHGIPTGQITAKFNLSDHYVNGILKNKTRPKKAE